MLLIFLTFFIIFARILSKIYKSYILEWQVNNTTAVTDSSDIVNFSNSE